VHDRRENLAGPLGQVSCPNGRKVQSMIRKSGYQFSLTTNAERVCAEIMLNQKPRSTMVIQTNPIAL
jgi:hypothetical protein